MDKNDEIEFDDNAIKAMPLTVWDVKERFIQIDEATKAIERLDEETKQKLKPVIDMAFNFTCNLCYELGFEDPAEIAESDYYCVYLKKKEE